MPHTSPLADHSPRTQHSISCFLRWSVISLPSAALPLVTVQQSSIVRPFPAKRALFIVSLLSLLLLLLLLVVVSVCVAPMFVGSALSHICVQHLHCSPTARSSQRSIGRSVGRSDGWLVGWLVGRLIGRLIGGLVG